MLIFKMQTSKIILLVTVALSLSCGACSPVSPSVSKLARSSGISNQDTNEVSDTASSEGSLVLSKKLRETIADLHENGGLFITERELAAIKYSNEKKKDRIFTEISEKFLVEFKKDWELTLTLDDLNLKSKALNRKMRLYIVVEPEYSGQDKRFIESFKSELEKITANDENPHGSLSIRIKPWIDENQNVDPVSATDMERELSNALRSIVILSE